MKKRVTILAAMLLAAGGAASCEEKIVDTSTVHNTIIGKWKLVGVVDAETSTLKVLEPKDCERCYTFTFDTDTTAWGYTVLNAMYIAGFIIGGTKLGEDGDAGICYDALFSVRSYVFNENELKFFFNNDSQYLLYKPLSPAAF